VKGKIPENVINNANSLAGFMYTRLYKPHTSRNGAPKCRYAPFRLECLCLSCCARPTVALRAADRPSARPKSVLAAATASGVGDRPILIYSQFNSKCEQHRWCFSDHFSGPGTAIGLVRVSVCLDV